MRNLRFDLVLDCSLDRDFAAVFLQFLQFVEVNGTHWRILIGKPFRFLYQESTNELVKI